MPSTAGLSCTTSECQVADITAAALKLEVRPQAIKPRPLMPPATRDGTLPLDANPATPPAATSILVGKPSP